MNRPGRPGVTQQDPVPHVQGQLFAQGEPGQHHAVSVIGPVFSRRAPAGFSGPDAPARAQHPDPGRGPGRADVQGQLLGQPVHPGQLTPDVDLPGQRPPARLDQRHAPGGELPRHAAQVERDPGHAADLPGRLLQGLDAAYPHRAQRRRQQQFPARAHGPGRQRAGHHRAAAADAEGPVHPQPDRAAGSGTGSDPASWPSARRNSGSPAPVTALTATAWPRPGWWRPVRPGPAAGPGSGRPGRPG